MGEEKMKDENNGEQFNIEIKARHNNIKCVRSILEEEMADWRGIDHQIDTYYKCAYGRLKLREGNIENKLIHYNRPNQAGPKQSDVILYQNNPPNTLKEVLDNALETLVVVDKEREIWFMGNVKIHLDDVKELGTFMELKAIDRTGETPTEKLYEQCEELIELFGIQKQDLIDKSYSDMLLEKNGNYSSLPSGSSQSHV